jgi:predicted RNA binding protein YcfA (HicA-like mRNA interferase family)
MPRKIRQLISDLKLAGFFLDRQKGSHRQFRHAQWPGIMTLSGGEGDDAQRYQEKQVTQAIAHTRKK